MIGSEADEQWERTLAQARGFRRRNADVLDTTGRAVPDLARQVIERTGWASQAARPQDKPAQRKRHDQRAAVPVSHECGRRGGAPDGGPA